MRTVKDQTFGIKMKQYCRAHEAEVLKQEPSRALLDRHLEKLAWIQHERLIHLIVTVLVSVCELFVLDLMLLHPELGILSAVMAAVLAVLLGFYFYHYFFLENTVQRWYVIADRLRETLEQEESQEEAGAGG